MWVLSHIGADRLGPSTLCPKCAPSRGSLHTSRKPAVPAQAAGTTRCPKALGGLPGRGGGTDI